MVFGVAVEAAAAVLDAQSDATILSTEIDPGAVGVGMPGNIAEAFLSNAVETEGNVARE